MPLSAPAVSQPLSVTQSNHNLIRAVQSALVIEGYDVGPIDGQLGQTTNSAFKQLEERINSHSIKWFNQGHELRALLEYLDIYASDYASPVDPTKRVGNPPSCSDLNKAWQWYRAVTILDGFDHTGAFSCPSTTSNAALSIYLLDALNMIDETGKERFDYFRYVFPKTEIIIPSDDPSSSGDAGITELGKFLLSTHAKDGSAYETMGIVGAVTLVHERRHFDQTVVTHVQCDDDDDAYSCDKKLTLLLDLPNGLDDFRVGAYSVDVAYLIDLIRFSKSNHKKRAKRSLGVILRRNFVIEGVTPSQINTINALLGTNYAM